MEYILSKIMNRARNVIIPAVTTSDHYSDASDGSSSDVTEVNKPPKRNSLTPTIGPEDDQNNSSKLSIHSDGEESNQLNQSQNRPLPDIITNVHSNNANISLSSLLDNFNSLGISSPNPKRSKDTLNVTTECVDPTSDDEAFVECNSFLDSSDRSNVTTPTSFLATEIAEIGLNNDLNVTISAEVESSAQEQTNASPNTVCVEDPSKPIHIAEQNLSNDLNIVHTTDIILPNENSNPDLANIHLDSAASMLQSTVDSVDIEGQEADASRTLPLDTSSAFIADHTFRTNDTVGDTTEAMINLCSETFEENADSTVNIDPQLDVIENSELNQTIQMSENASNEINNRTVDEHIHEASVALSRSIDAIKSVSQSLIIENIDTASAQLEIDETVVNVTCDVIDVNNDSFCMAGTSSNEANNILATIGNNAVQSKETSIHSKDDSFSAVSNEIESLQPIEQTHEVDMFASLGSKDVQSKETSDHSKVESFSAALNEVESSLPIEQAKEPNNTLATIDTNEPIDPANETYAFNSYEFNGTMPSGVAKSKITDEINLPAAVNNDQHSPLVDQRITDTIENEAYKSSPKDRALIPNAFNIPIKIGNSRRMSNGTGLKTDETPRPNSPIGTLNVTQPSASIAPMDRANANTILTGAARLDLHSAIDRLYTVPSNPNLNTTITTAVHPNVNDRTINYDFNATHDIWPSTEREELVTEFLQNPPQLNHTFVGPEVSTAFDMTVDKSNTAITGRKSILVRQDLFRPDLELENDYVEDMDVDMDLEQNVDFDDGGAAGGSGDIDNYFDAFAFKIPQEPTQARIPFVISDHHVPSTDVLFNQCDFDFLQSKGSNASIGPGIDSRSSLLIRFDPLLGRPVSRTPEKQPPNRLSVTKEEHFDTEKTVVGGGFGGSGSAKVPDHGGNATMSAGFINDLIPENEVKPFDSINNKVEKEELQMVDLERKIKVERDDVDRKLKAAEQREESHIKRITEKDKAITKMSGVMEAYEKAIAELVSEKEHLIRSHENKCVELQADRDLNFQHLSSLETTFSDLHVKYERSKQISEQLKETQDKVDDHNRYMLEQLKLQEQRYDKMKNHALQQLEAANSKLDTILRGHAIELTKLKAHLKKEEISRQSVTEQLVQKTKENEELVKICDELINGQGS